MKKFTNAFTGFLLLFLLAGQGVKSQPLLYILTNGMFDSTQISNEVVNAGLSEAAKQILADLNLSDKFTLVVTKNKVVQPGDNFIKMYSSYAYCTSGKNDSIIPEYIVHKRNWQTPYYYSYFIGRKKLSRFNSFNDFASIKTIYLQNYSMSGYYAPLYRFWEMGYIKNPSVRSLKEELKKEVVIKNSPQEVITAVSKDEGSIGATGEEDFLGLDVEIKLVNMVLPQDVICLSKTLTPFEGSLNVFIYKLFSDTSLVRKLHIFITRVEPMTQSSMNSYEFNKEIIKVVNDTKDSYNKEVFIKRMIPLNDDITIGNILDVIEKSSISVYISIIAFLSAFYVLGFHTGKIFLPFFDRVKRKFKNLFTYNRDDE